MSWLGKLFGKAKKAVPDQVWRDLRNIRDAELQQFTDNELAKLHEQVIREFTRRMK